MPVDDCTTTPHVLPHLTCPLHCEGGCTTGAGSRSIYASREFLYSRGILCWPFEAHFQLLCTTWVYSKGSRFWQRIWPFDFNCLHSKYKQNSNLWCETWISKLLSLDILIHCWPAQNCCQALAFLFSHSAILSCPAPSIKNVSAIISRLSSCNTKTKSLLDSGLYLKWEPWQL